MEKRDIPAVQRVAKCDRSSGSWSLIAPLVLVLIGWMGMGPVQPIQAQGHAILDEFKASAGTQQVQLSWVIKSGSTCNGIKIFRAVDTAKFSQIGFFSGVCGSPSSAIPYEFTDHEPVPNRVNYYRLDLGGQGFTQILAVEFILLNRQNFLVLGNPIEQGSVLHFRNDGSRKVRLRIGDLKGQEVYMSPLSFTDRFSLIGLGLGPGMYLFTVYAGSEILSSGRILVP